MDQLICTLKLSVSINVNILELPTQTLTKDIFKKGKPSIKQTAEGFHLHLFNKVVGNFPPNASTALSTIVKEKLGIFTAMVGLDAHKTNHGMAIVNITALAANAFPIIYRISAHLKDEFENIVLVPPNIASTPGVHAVIQRSKKRHNLSSNNNSVLAKKVKTSNKAEETVENKTNITFSKSVNISKNVSITVKSPNQKVSQETSNVLNVVSKESSMSLTLNMSFNESIINTPSSSATSTQSFSFPLVSKATTPFSTITTSSTQKPTSISKHFVESHDQCKATKRSGAASVSRGNNVAVIKKKPIVNAPKTGLLSSVDDLLKTVQKDSSGPTQSSSSENIQSINTVVSVIKQEKADSMLQNSSSEKNLNNLVNTTNVSKVGDVSSIHTSNQLCSMNNVSVLNSYTPSRLSNLPENIIEKIGSFREDHREMGRLQNSENNLLFEGASTGETCNFLLGRTPILQQGVDQEIISDASSSDQAAANNNVSSGIEVVDISCDNNEPELVLRKTPLDDLFDLMSELPQDQEQEPCAAIQQAMLPHQKIALHWMIERENTDELPPFWECVDEGRDYFNTATLERKYWEKPECVHGGILADDMGLGKTLTAIALILTNHIEGKPMFRKVSNNKALPLTADEIDETIPGSKMLSIKKKKDGYLKASKTTRSDMMKPGFRFRQMYKENLTKSKKSKKSMKVKKEVKQPSDNLFSDDSDDDHKDLSAKHVEHIIRNHFPTTTGSKRRTFSQVPDRHATLIISPMSVVSNWTTQFESHIDPSVDLQIYVYYGPERVRDLEFIKKHDIILTTYGTLTNDYKSIEKKRRSPLHDMYWLRVILDEGHIIRNARSQQTAAVMALNSTRRWLLTGTPIQNRMSDLWSILKFLRLEPFHLRKWWTQYVIESMRRRPKPGEIVFNRVQKIIRHIAIRRMKTDQINGQPIVKLPERKIVIQKIKFCEEERKLYDAMQKDGKLIVCKYFRMNAVMKNYANVLAIIMRLRQLCCHPNLCIKAVKKLQKAMEMMQQLGEQVQGENEGAGDEEGDGVISEKERENLIEQLMQLLSSGDSEECSICLENLQEPVITKCAHVFCQSCISEVIDTSENGASCPLCRAEIDVKTMVKVPQSKTVEENGDYENSKDNSENSSGVPDDEEWHSSAKLDALMEILLMQRQDNPRMKSLVVSQFTSFLDVIEKPLRENGFHFVRLDGTMTQGRRMRVIDEFQSDNVDSPIIMLLSLTAGGVGLNLVAANRVFLLDPAWNPAIEEQCFDRCHRLGQKKDVLIIKFIVEDTVEDRMLILQKQKRELMERAFGITQASPEERRAAALRDIGTLLGIDFGRAARQRRNIVIDDDQVPGPSNAPQQPDRPDSPNEDLPIIPLGIRNINRNRRLANI